MKDRSGASLGIDGGFYSKKFHDPMLKYRQAMDDASKCPCFKCSKRKGCKEECHIYRLYANLPFNKSMDEVYAILKEIENGTED